MHKSTVTIPPGVPQEDIGDIISIIEQHMKAGNNETVATLIPAAVKAYGVTAVTKALNKVRV